MKKHGSPPRGASRRTAPQIHPCLLHNSGRRKSNYTRAKPPQDTIPPSRRHLPQLAGPRGRGTGIGELTRRTPRQAVPLQQGLTSGCTISCEDVATCESQGRYPYSPAVAAPIWLSRTAVSTSFGPTTSGTSPAKRTETTFQAPKLNKGTLRPFANSRVPISSSAVTHAKVTARGGGAITRSQ
jgi:hypothetical protein